ncbi:hypothetical protein EVG20_g5363 [Dentipellis fragilis]|uniref:Uncharacterized protein n=1 Tax=Dentipellis fragilis TaxID=205917 RepID=A0A4Y9YVV5_9AGAM|nr:hypothetical protein EVG20_g5363 [Dentipellis fragilis]
MAGPVTTSNDRTILSHYQGSSSSGRPNISDAANYATTILRLILTSRFLKLQFRYKGIDVLPVTRGIPCSLNRIYVHVHVNLLANLFIMRSFAVGAFVSVLLGLQIASTAAAPIDSTDPDVIAQENNLPSNLTRAGLCQQYAPILADIGVHSLSTPSFSTDPHIPQPDIVFIGKNGKVIDRSKLCKGFQSSSSTAISPTATGTAGSGQCATPVTVTVTATADGSSASLTDLPPVTTADPVTSPSDIPPPIPASNAE